MTVYARSDLMSVSISPLHGGCGETHSRPVNEGAPDKVWSLTCNDGCEDILRSDPHWASHPDDIPETPDEKMRRENQQRAGQRDQENATAQAMQELAKMPGAFQQLAAAMMAGRLPGQEGPTTETCSNEHVVPTGLKFCPECGTSMLVSDPPPADPDAKDEPPASTDKPPAKKAPARKPPASN